MKKLPVCRWLGVDFPLLSIIFAIVAVACILIGSICRIYWCLSAGIALVFCVAGVLIGYNSRASKERRG